MSDAFFKAGMIMGELSSAVADLKKENADKTETIDEMAKLIDRQRDLLDECERSLIVLDRYSKHHAADAPEWRPADSVTCYLTIADLRRATSTLARLRAAQEKADE